MKINQNNDIFIYRGETGAIDFKISQRSDYYVPFLISSERVNPYICITIGSTRRESKNIVTKQLWLDWADLNLPTFTQTTVNDLTTISVDLSNPANVELIFRPMIEYGIMYQFKVSSEVAANNPILHFIYENADGDLIIDDYHFTVILALDDTITLDMTNNEYFYQIELMDTELMIPHIIELLTEYPALIKKLPTAFTNTEIGVNTYLKECITLISKTFPKHWGHRITNPYTCPVASVSAIQILQPPRNLIVQAVVK